MRVGAPESCIVNIYSADKGFKIIEEQDHAPILRIQGLKVLVEWEEEK